MKRPEPIKFIELADAVVHWAFDSDDKCFCGQEKDIGMMPTEAEPTCEDCIKLFPICSGQGSEKP